MEKAIFVLTYMGKAVAAIQAESETQLKEKVATAIKEEVSAEPDTQFSLRVGRIGDWGETTTVKTDYVNDGLLIQDEEFTLTKLVAY